MTWANMHDMSNDDMSATKNLYVTGYDLLQELSSGGFCHGSHYSVQLTSKLSCKKTGWYSDFPRRSWHTQTMQVVGSGGKVEKC